MLSTVWAPLYIEARSCAIQLKKRAIYIDVAAKVGGGKKKVVDPFQTGL